jgi:hypothetical protein
VNLIHHNIVFIHFFKIVCQNACPDDNVMDFHPVHNSTVICDDHSVSDVSGVSLNAKHFYSLSHLFLSLLLSNHLWNVSVTTTFALPSLIQVEHNEELSSIVPGWHGDGMILDEVTGSFISPPQPMNKSFYNHETEVRFFNTCQFISYTSEWNWIIDFLLLGAVCCKLEWIGCNHGWRYRWIHISNWLVRCR